MSQKLEKLILEIDLIDDNKEKQNKIIKLLDIINEFNIEEYKRLYFIGYLWYISPTESNIRNKQIVHNLKASVSLKSNYIYSKVYLAYFYFDNKNFHDVIEILKDVDFSFFEEINQLWQSLKLQELLSVSKLYVNKIIDKELSSEILGLISAYLILPEEDLAVPRELVSAVLENIYKEGIVNIKLNIFQLINSSSHKDFFSDTVRIELMSNISK